MSDEQISAAAGPPSVSKALFPSHELARLLFWTEVVTRQVADDGWANDENVSVEARDLYNLLHALRETRELIARQPPVIPHVTMWDGSRTCWCGEHHPWDTGDPVATKREV